MQEKSFSKIKKQNPISIIVHSSNIIGTNLAKILLEQGSKVILIDTFDSKSKGLISELKKIGEVDFVDIGGIDDLMGNIGRVDYLFYIQSEFLLENQTFTSKDFLEESNNLNLCLKVAQKYNAKSSLISSVSLNEKLTQYPDYKPSSYSSEELQRYSETLTAEYHDRAKINVRIIRVGTALGKESNVEKFTSLNQLFEDSVNSDAIKIAGEGLDVHYLIHLSDLIFGILKLTFSSETNGEVISLCNDNEYSTLSIAYKLLELNPNATEIKFIANPNRKRVLHDQYIPAPNAEKYGWEQKKRLEKSIAETLDTKFKKYNKKWAVPPLDESAYKKKLEEIRTKKTSKGKRQGNVSIVATPTGEAVSKVLGPLKNINIKEIFRSKNLFKTLTIFLILLPIFYFLVYPLFSIGINTFAIYKSTSELSENISDLNNENVKDELTSLNRNMQNINRGFENLNWIFLLTQQTDIYDETSTLLHALETGSEGLVTLADGTEPLIRYLNEFEPALSFEDGTSTTTREYTNILRDLEKNSDKIAESSYKISQALQAIDQVNKEVYPQFIQENIGEIQTAVSPLRKNIDDVAQIVQFLPDTLGVDGRKRYLVLLQNPGELRSTGGWITSYVIIGVEGGQIRELKVDDVYELDGELKNQGKNFEPPSDMLEALELDLFGLSLSNWEPNFPDAAKEAKFFVKEAGAARSVDGVITIDIYLLQDLLDLWGGINIPGERDLITSENIYEKVFFLHEHFTPGQSQKATFLTKLADEVISKIASSDFEENSQVFNSILNSLETKNILLYFNNVNAQRYFSQRGWAGELLARKHNFTPSPIEWNWGANKANLYLEREQQIKTEILSLNEIEVEYSLTLKNNSVSENYPQGEYKNYLRLYLPQSAEVSTVTGFSKNNYSTSYKKGFKILEGWFNIPTSTTKELSVSYYLENANDILLVEEDEVFLQSTIFKQPGTSKKDSLRMDITYPENWAIVEEGNFDRVRFNLIKQTQQDREENLYLIWELQ